MPTKLDSGWLIRTLCAFALCTTVSNVYAQCDVQSFKNEDYTSIDDTWRISVLDEIDETRFREINNQRSGFFKVILPDAPVPVEGGFTWNDFQKERSALKSRYEYSMDAHVRREFSRRYLSETGLQAYRECQRRGATGVRAWVDRVTDTVAYLTVEWFPPGGVQLNNAILTVRSENAEAVRRISNTIWKRNQTTGFEIPRDKTKDLNIYFDMSDVSSTAVFVGKDPILTRRVSFELTGEITPLDDRAVPTGKTQKLREVTTATYLGIDVQRAGNYRYNIRVVQRLGKDFCAEARRDNANAGSFDGGTPRPHFDVGTQVPPEKLQVWINPTKSCS